jgi:uncharacterized HAD superfamily protein
VRIAIDIDSTLHHYWDQLAAAAKRRFGVDLPYEDQVTWAVDKLRPEQLRACVRETHRDENVLAAIPYPGAVATVRRWHETGHFILITSHRAVECNDATRRWLADIALPYDLLHCSYDKISHCVEHGVDLLVDDSPVNLADALDAGMAAATLRHPWNADLCESEPVVCAPDWPALATALEPRLSADGARRDRHGDEGAGGAAAGARG